MSYQIIPITNAVKSGVFDSESREVVWNQGSSSQGLKYANDGHIILIARSEIAIAEDSAVWSTTHATGVYAALLTKTGTGADISTHLEFTPTTTITLNDFAEAIDAATPAWSFEHWSSADTGNFAQIEFRFEHASLARLGVDHGWLEVTCLPLQGHTGGDAAFVLATLATGTSFGFGGHTPDGSSIFEWGAHTLTNLLTDVNTAWNTAETGEAATAYVLKRIRIELWETLPGRSTYIDTIIIDGTNYPVEPGMAGAKLRHDATATTLNFVDVRDRFGRFETLTPTVGPQQKTIVGPLLPALFNDSGGYVRFLPSAFPGAPATLFYSAIRVGDAT